MIQTAWRAITALFIALAPPSIVVAKEQHRPSKQILETTLATCYEVDPDFLPTINETVQNLTSKVRQAESAGKMITYLSVPLTARGGGYRPVNVEISEFLKLRVEAMFQGNVWVLAPGTVESELPTVNGRIAQGGEYMYMWTQVLAGTDGMGRDFDMLFAAGPSEIGAFFGPPNDPVGALQRYIDLRAKADPDFRTKVAASPDTKKSFIAYYSTKASVAFSSGSHDEWNIFVEINQRRRSHPEQFGLGNQIPVLFDGRSVSPAEMETKVSPGYEQPCPRE
jgi:hypothetical protein